MKAKPKGFTLAGEPLENIESKSKSRLKVTKRLRFLVKVKPIFSYREGARR